MENSKQFVQLPSTEESSDLNPRDKLIYLSIRRFMNKETKVAYPSLTTISKVSGASINTVRTSIKTLEAKDYFKIIKEGRSQRYKFNELKKFEPFSYDFLDNQDLTFTEKAYIVASQQYMFKDVEGVGKISYSNKELSEKINMPESTISKTNRILARKNYLTLIKYESRNIETGCNTDTKLFRLNELGQAVIWTLENHEDRITDNENRITKLEQTIESQTKLIQSLLKEREKPQIEYIM